MENYDKLKEYKELYGICLVPQNYQKDTSLGNFVHNERSYHNLLQRGKNSSMKLFHVKLLNEIEFE